MRIKLYRLLVLCVLGAVVVASGAGCADVAAEDADAIVAPPGVVAARDAALEYLRANLGDAPPAGLEWRAQDAWRAGRLGAGGYAFIHKEWSVLVTYPVVHPDLVVYSVQVVDDGEAMGYPVKVDAKGRVILASEAVLMARDVALAHWRQELGDGAPDVGIAWEGAERGAEFCCAVATQLFEKRPWSVVVTYAADVETPDAYAVKLANGERWIGSELTISADGEVIAQP